MSKWPQNDVKSQKMQYLKTFSVWNSKILYSCYSHHKVPCYVHCNISIATKWAPVPLLSKGKIRISLLQELLFALVVHSVGVSKYMDISQHNHKKVC